MRFAEDMEGPNAERDPPRRGNGMRKAIAGMGALLKDWAPALIVGAAIYFGFSNGANALSEGLGSRISEGAGGRKGGYKAGYHWTKGHFW